MIGGLEFFLARRVAVEDVPRVSLSAISHRDNFDNPLSLRLNAPRMAGPHFDGDSSAMIRPASMALSKARQSRSV